jgi:phage tail-like protein
MGDARALEASLSFRLRIDGIDRGGFRECAGLDTSQDPIDYRALSPAPQPAVRDVRIVLRAGIVVDDPILSSWQAGLADAKPICATPGRDITLALLDRTGRRELRRWQVRGARPVAWKGPQLAATGAQAVVDALELVCDEVEFT